MQPVSLQLISEQASLTCLSPVCTPSKNLFQSKFNLNILFPEALDITSPSQYHLIELDGSSPLSPKQETKFYTHIKE
jgi:hypothetical protein